MDLAIFTALFAAFALTLYTLLDGFDLGVGALLLVQKDARLRDSMIDAIAPTWDGNETWIVMAAIALFAGFPIAYGIVLPALYLPLIVMLLALGIRGVTFEFRVQSRNYKRQWDTAFGVASAVAALAQGAAAGTLIFGVHVEADRFAGSVFDVVNPLALLSGCALLAGYVMLGAGWLRVKEKDELRAFAGRTQRKSNVVFIILIAFAWIAAAIVQPEVRSRFVEHWFSFSFLAILLLASQAIAMLSVAGNSDRKPFAYGALQFALAAVGAWLMVYPDIVPFRVSLWSAASAQPTQAFLLTGAAIVTPVILTYSAFAYRVFRGKTPAAGWYS
jgi:cytochrome bd ubiquinol oxidase subunit II